MVSESLSDIIGAVRSAILPAEVPLWPKRTEPKLGFTVRLSLPPLSIDQPSNEPAINEDVQADSNTTEDPKEEEKIEVEIDEETDNEFSDVSQDVFFTDGEVVSEELADDVEEAFAMLGFSNQEDEGRV